MAQNIFANSLDVGQKVYDQQQQFRQDFGATQAGKRLAGGDRAGAMQALGASGNVDGVRVMQRDQMQAEDRDRQQKAETIKQRAEVLNAVVGHLQALPEGQRRPALDGAMPLFQAAQIDPTPFANLTEDNLRDQNLIAFTGQLAKQVEQYTLTPGSRRFDANGNLIAEAPTAPTYHTVGEGQSLVETGGGSPAPAPAALDDWASGVAAAAPDAQVTSGYRTPAHNAEVGGVRGSRHTTGQAVDLVPRPGETMAQLYARVSRAPGVRAINEGNHVHVQANGARPAAPAQRGARVVAQGPPKRTGHVATSAERAALGINSSAPVWIGADGKPDVISDGSPSAKEQRTASISLRKEFDQSPDVKSFQTVATQYDVINRLASAPPTAPNDVSMIFAYMKVLDPTSVVREGEFATAQNTVGLPGQVVNAYNKALNGQRLSPNQRHEFTQAAGRIYQANKTRYDQLVGQYQGYASNLGLGADTIQPRVAVAPATVKPPPSKRPPLADIFR